MPAIQDFSIPQGDDMDIPFTLDPMDNISLDGATVYWAAYEQEFGTPILTVDSGGVAIPAQVIEKDSATGGATVLPSPGQFIVHLTRADTELLPLGNYYHEAEIVDRNNDHATVCQGAMAVTLALQP